MLLLLLPVGCSDYSLEKAVEEGKVPQEETTDTASPGDVDGPDDTEDPPTEACNGEDDDGDGAVDGGRAGSDEDIAWTGDMGVSDRFSIEVDISWTGSLNDFAGIARAVSGTDAFVVRWDDPQGDYGHYTPTGAVDIAVCSAGVCTLYAVESATDLYRPADQSMSLLQVTVDGSSVEVSVDGTSVLVTDVPEVDGAGPGGVGVFSNDNDGGVWFDDYRVGGRRYGRRPTAQGPGAAPGAAGPRGSRRTACG